MNMKFSFIKLMVTTVSAVVLVAGITMLIAKIADVSNSDVDVELFYLVSASSLGCIAYIPWLAINYDFFNEVCDRITKTVNAWERKQAEKHHK